MSSFTDGREKETQRAREKDTQETRASGRFLSLIFFFFLVFCPVPLHLLLFGLHRGRSDGFLFCIDTRVYSSPERRGDGIRQRRRLTCIDVRREKETMATGSYRHQDRRLHIDEVYIHWTNRTGRRRRRCCHWKGRRRLSSCLVFPRLSSFFPGLFDFRRPARGATHQSSALTIAS